MRVRIYIQHTSLCSVLSEVDEKYVKSNIATTVSTQRMRTRLQTMRDVFALPIKPYNLLETTDRRNFDEPG